MQHCNIALGGYWNHARLEHCHISHSQYGLKDLISSTVNGGSFSHNHHGIHMGIGASDNSFIGVRVEWNRHCNYLFYRNSANTILGGCIDRAGSYGVHASDCELTLSAVQLRRNGYLHAGRSHILCDSIRTLIMQGTMTSHGVFDMGDGYHDSPDEVIRFTGTNHRVLLGSNDFSGYRQRALSGQETVKAFTQVGNLGL